MQAVGVAGSEFTHGGKTYYIPRTTQGDKKRWHVWANARAVNEAEANEAGVQEGWLTFASYKALVDQARTWAVTGWFHPDNVGGREMRRTNEGVAAAIWVSMNRHDPRVTLAEVEKLADELPGLLLAKWNEANSDPNQPAPPTSGANMTTSESDPSNSNDGLPKNGD